MIVVDASVLVAAVDVDDTAHGESLGLVSSGQPLAILDLTLYEIQNAALRFREEANAALLHEFAWGIAELGQLVRVDAALSTAIRHTARRLQLTAYDAAYVAAAAALGADLASCDVGDLVGPGYAKLPGELLA